MLDEEVLGQFKEILRLTNTYVCLGYGASVLVMCSVYVCLCECV